MKHLSTSLIRSILEYLRFEEQKACFKADTLFHVWCGTMIQDRVVKAYLAAPLKRSLYDGYFDIFLKDLSQEEMVTLFKTGIDWNGDRLFTRRYGSGCSYPQRCDWLSCGCSGFHYNFMSSHKKKFSCDLCEATYCLCSVKGHRCHRCGINVCNHCQTRLPHIIICNETNRLGCKTCLKDCKTLETCVVCNKYYPSYSSLPKDLGRHCESCAKIWLEECAACHEEVFYGNIDNELQMCMQCISYNI